VDISLFALTSLLWWLVAAFAVVALLWLVVAFSRANTEAGLLDDLLARGIIDVDEYQRRVLATSGR
jgi:hypothetical protein